MSLGEKKSDELKQKAGEKKYKRFFVVCSCLCIISLKQQKISDENHLQTSDKVPGVIKMINKPAEQSLGVGRLSGAIVIDDTHEWSQRVAKIQLFKKLLLKGHHKFPRSHK